MTSPSSDYAHVRELVKAGLFQSEDEATEALRTAGVPLAGRVYLREALREALRLGRPFNHTQQELGLNQAGPGELEGIVRACLRPHGIEVDAVRAGRTSLMQLSAVVPRVFVAMDEDPAHAITIAQGSRRPWAKVYATTERRRGQAQFSANGYRQQAGPGIYIFTLLSERRVWVASRRDLVQFEDEAREASAHGDVARHGVGVLQGQVGTLRLWFRREETHDSFHLSMRIADEHGRLVARDDG